MKFQFATMKLIGCVVAFLCFATSAAVAASTTPATAAVITDKSPTGELSYWNQVKESTDAADLLNYLVNFPNGMFFDLAKSRYEQLSGMKYDPANVPVPAQENAAPGNADQSVKAVTDGTKKSKIVTKKLNITVHQKP